MTTRRSLLAILPLLAGACSSTMSAATTTTVAATSTAAQVTTASATTAGGSTSIAATTAQSTTAAPTTTVAPTTTIATLRCHTSELSASLGASNGGAGQLYVPLIIRNVGTRTCQVHGYPGVSLLDGSGTQIGAPATREAITATTVSLAPGAMAAAVLHTTNGPIGGPCLAPSVKMRVYPPDEFDAIDFPAAFTACGGFSVRPFVSGTTGI